jgi:hypothetical protein
MPAVSREIALLVDTLGFMAGGGHTWVFLNWALGLRANGCRVHWVEPVPRGLQPDALQARVHELQRRLAPHGLADAVCLVDWTQGPRSQPALPGCAPFAEVAAGAELALNFAYGTPAPLLAAFRRSALVDIDPGLTQLWLARGQMTVAPHTLYFTTGETVGSSDTIPDCGLPWRYTPPCVALDAWPVQPPAAAGAPFSTVSGWYAEEWIDDGREVYRNDKRSGFQPFLDLPRHTSLPLELALNLGDDVATEGAALRAHGWRLRHAYEAAGTPADYQRYVQTSRGEFSAVKPSCVALRNAWISDRSLCYLASGRPVIVRHTGPSRFLPEDEGLFRFHDVAQAAAMLERAAADAAHHGRRARELAAACFDATRVTRSVLSQALD